VRSGGDGWVARATQRAEERVELHDDRAIVVAKTAEVAV
jgi:hypothetical protein